MQEFESPLLQINKKKKKKGPHVSLPHHNFILLTDGLCVCLKFLPRPVLFMDIIDILFSEFQKLWYHIFHVSV